MLRPQVVARSSASWRFDAERSLGTGGTLVHKGVECLMSQSAPVRNSLNDARSESSALPAVSVIVPAYGVTAYIAEALDSVLAQSYTDYEIVVVNDGCPDSVALEAALRPYLGRIVYVKKQNGGLASARNAGISVARAQLIALLDGDDTWTPDYLAVQTEYLQTHPDVDVVYCNGVIFGDTPLAGRKVMEFSPSHGEVNFESLASCRCSVNVQVLARKAAIVGVGGFDERLRRVEDFDLWLRAAHAGVRIAYHRRPLYRYRRREGALSADDVAMCQAALSVLDKASRTLSLSPAEKLALLQGQQRFATDMLYFRMKAALRANDARAALSALRQLPRLRWNLKYALLRIGLRYAPWLTLRIADRHTR
jgi:glycosyltransferase involved in cell wall biosynthesis